MRAHRLSGRTPAIPKPHRGWLRPGPLVAVLAALAAAAVLLAPPVWLPDGTAATAALMLVTIGLWASGIVSEALASLLFFLAAMLFAVAPAEAVFAGFGASAFWLIFAGLVLSLAIRHTGLGERIAGGLLTRAPRSYPLLVTASVVVGTVFAFLMPGSMGRIVLLVPIALAVADRAGFAAAARGRFALVLGVVFGTHLTSFAILPANVPNVVWASAVEAQHGFQVGYLEYLWWHFPVLGLLRAALLVALLLWWLPDRLSDDQAHDTPATPPGEAAAGERQLAAVLLAALALWATDFAHGIAPAWVALAAACYCLLPPTRLTPERPYAALDVGPLLFVAGVLGLGETLARSGLGEAAFAQLLPLLPLSPGADTLNFGVLGLGSALLGVFTTLPGVPAVASPLAPAIAGATGWPLEAVLVTLTVGYATFLLPYQAPPILVGGRLGGVPWGVLTRFTLGYAAVSTLLVFPLQYLWLHLVGVYGF
ncbi:sodium:sulfate symporter [Spiribacter halobius]|uniref:Sodium:sulfate symporter n=1 Tax=Sediminicurvatus halobius TaxID=2182432 RepID=A0A2U2N6A5_9GAMM|nr:sodium:sulfate symporter [Spiribacter halobius]